MIYKALTKPEYLSSVHSLLTDPSDIKFSRVAIGMWDFMKAWEQWPVRVLLQENEVISVCFMKISSQAGSKVLFISNIFTPTSGRGKGGAREMLDRNIKEAVALGATTIRLDCNRKALGFYDKLNMSYWGTTISHSMFCDLPIDVSGVDSFKKTKNLSASEILDSYPKKLREAKIKWIHKKVKKHKEFDFGHPSRCDEFMKIYEQNNQSDSLSELV
jgi:hypothetical protein